MATDKDNKVEKEVKEIKKLDDVKDTPENKKAITKAEGKTTEVDAPKVLPPAQKASSKEDKVSKESKPAVEKKSKSKKVDKKEVVELEREYIVPLKRGVLNVPHYRRAKKAVRVLKEFMVQHMKVRDRDLNKVKIDMYLNNELWFRGIKKPANKIKVKAKKIGGIVYVELAEIPEAVGYKMAWAEKRKAQNVVSKTKVPKQKKVEEEDKDKDGVNDKVEEKEDAKSGAEKAAKVQKAEVKTQKHTAQGKHAQKTMPVRKVLK